MASTTKKRSGTKKKAATKTKRNGSKPKTDSRADSDGLSLYASALASAAVPTLFGGLFKDCWQAFQTRQITIQQSTQDAYNVFMATVQKIWDQEDVKSRLNAACRDFALSIQQAAREPQLDTENEDSAEQHYRNYVNALQQIWSDPEIMERLEQAFVDLSESIQQTAANAEEVFQEEQKNYVNALRSTWAATADASLIDDETLTAVSKSMVATVFFTEGIQNTN